MTDDAGESGRTPGYDSRCKPCNDPYHDEYDKAYFHGEISKTEYAKKVGCSINSVTRHLDGHVPKDLAIANDIKAIAKADTLLDDIRSLREKAITILEKAELAGDLKTALMGIREARGCIELLAKVEGQLDNRPQINILVNPEWIELRTTIIAALDPYPAARGAVINAIRQ